MTGVRIRWHRGLCLGGEASTFLSFAKGRGSYPPTPLILVFVCVQPFSATLFGCALSTPHISRAPSFATQNHAAARDSNAAQRQHSGHGA